MGNLLQIIGFFIGDGYWLGDRAAFSNTNEDLIKYYSQEISIAGFRTSLYRRKKLGNRKDEFTLVVEKSFSVQIKKEMENLLHELASIEGSKSFLRGIFDAEGSINFSSTRRGREIKFTNTNRRIIYLIRFCLWQLKIKSRIKIVRGFRPNRKTCFDVRTYGESSIKFLKNVHPYKISSAHYLEGKVNPKYKHLFE